MTEFWISNARHYCKECKCWMDAKPSSIRKHEEGYRHKGNVDRSLKQMKRDKIFAQRESHKAAMEYAAIERAAKKQYVKDCASGLASADGQCAFNKSTDRKQRHNYRRKDKPTFLPSDDDLFYYLDKNGNCHGPYPSFTMCKWYHFGFFVGGLRIRKREDTQFIHLRDLQNPFHYSQFIQTFNTDVQFRTRISKSIDISNASTVPPGIDIPAKLKNEFYKMYPQTQTKAETKHKTSSKHQFYSTGIQSDRSLNKEQRRTFIRGHLRKYKSNTSKCNCGDSDCYLKHNKQNEMKEDENHAESEQNIKKIEVEKTDETKNGNEDNENNKDEFGFAKWETVTKEEFDAKHSNKHMIEKHHKKKRWWRDQINANLPIAKRKKLMGLQDTDSENERDFDDEYDMNQIVKLTGNKTSDGNNDKKSGFNSLYNEASDTRKIAISIETKRNIKECINAIDDEENVMIKDAKLKLKQIHENEEKIKLDKKEKVIQKLHESIEKEQTAKTIMSSNNLFKKKKKKKNRQRGKIESIMR